MSQATVPGAQSVQIPQNIISAKYKIVPRKARISGLTSGRGKLTIKASKVNGGCAYQFAYKKSDDKKWSYVRSKKPKMVIKRLKSGMTYTVKVRAYKKVNGIVYNGKWSKATKIRVS